MPGFLPVELLGLTSSVAPRGTDRVLASILIVAAVLAAVALLVRRCRGAAWVGAAVVLILISHAAVYLREGGPTYRQWKWITFFQPIFAAGALVVVGLALGRPLARRVPRAAQAVPVVLALAVAVAAYRESGEQLGPPLREDHPAAYADVGLSHLEDNPELAGVDQLDVDVNPYWDTMWVVYFLPDTTLHLLQPSYFASTPPASAWILTKRVGELSGAPYVPLTERFRLERSFAGPTSAHATGLDATISVQSAQLAGDGQLRAHVVVTNTGSASWLPLEKGIGGVELGAHLASAAGDELDHDYARQPLVPGWNRAILPGGSVDLDVAVPAPANGAAVVELQVVSEGIAWFGASVPVTTAAPGARPAAVAR